jgi:uncharacterized peroxidase-related enzyme
MTTLKPLALDRIRDVSPELIALSDQIGYLPNALATLARKPQILKSLLALVQSVTFQDGFLSPGFRSLLSLVASKSASCSYSTAHAAYSAYKRGMPVEKIVAAYSSSMETFSPSEAMALELAKRMGKLPVPPGKPEVEDLKLHFTTEEVLEIATVVCMFGWFNRFNSTIKPKLEPEPLAFAEKHLMSVGWSQ